MTEIENLRPQLHAAIDAGLTQLAPSIENGDLAGFAIGTDDDVGSLFAVACTRKWLSANGEDVKFQFNEWEEYVPEETFNTVSRILFDLSTSNFIPTKRWPEFRDRLFGIIVEELAMARLDHRVRDDVFMCVGSTDPSDHLLDLELSAVRQLNCEPVVRAYEESMSC